MLTQEKRERGRKGERKTAFWVGQYKREKKRKIDKKMRQKDR